VVGVPDLSLHSLRQQLMASAFDTGMGLLIETADALEMAGGACDSSEDAEHFFSLAQRVRNYLAMSRATTTLGMPRIVSDEARLTDENVIHRNGESDRTYIRILPD
jgi:hypothetical protein